MAPPCANHLKPPRVARVVAVCFFLSHACTASSRAFVVSARRAFLARTFSRPRWAHSSKYSASCVGVTRMRWPTRACCNRPFAISPCTNQIERRSSCPTSGIVNAGSTYFFLSLGRDSIFFPGSMLPTERRTNLSARARYGKDPASAFRAFVRRRRLCHSSSRRSRGFCYFFSPHAIENHENFYKNHHCSPPFPNTNPRQTPRAWRPAWDVPNGQPARIPSPRPKRALGRLGYRIPSLLTTLPAPKTPAWANPGAPWGPV